MRLISIVATALFVLAAATQAAAAPMAKKTIVSPKALAQAIEGNDTTVLGATPDQFRQALKDLHEVELADTAALAVYIRGLESVDAPSGTYEVSGMRGDDLVVRGGTREPKPGEKAFREAGSAKIVFLASCGNVARFVKKQASGDSPGLPVVNPTVNVTVDTAALAVALAGYHPQGSQGSEHCHPGWHGPGACEVDGGWLNSCEEFIYHFESLHPRPLRSPRSEFQRAHYPPLCEWRECAYRGRPHYVHGRRRIGGNEVRWFVAGPIGGDGVIAGAGGRHRW